MQVNNNHRQPQAILLSVFPFLRWFREYNLNVLRSDFISGMTVALVLIPQSMAYAQLAGLPAYYGLYAAFLPPMIAALFGSSRQLATGPVAVVSLMTATALEPLATAGAESYIAYAILLALLVGIFQFALGVLRLGLVVNFLSHPVVNGFTNAAALIIATSQLSKLFGVYVDKADHHYETVFGVIKAAVSYTYLPSLALAVLAFVIMITLKRISPRIPNVLVAVVTTTVISWAIGFEHNLNASLNQIDDTRGTDLIKRFNGKVLEVESKSEERVLVGALVADTLAAYGEHSAEVISLQHRLSLLNFEIEELKKESGLIRSELRALRFRAVQESDGKLRFYRDGALPAGERPEGHRCRLSVGSKFLDETSITFIGGGAVVGNIPSGLPKLKMPQVDAATILSLFPMAIVISLLGFMEAISIAKAMAVKTGQRLDPNQELVGQGLANIVGSIGQSYAVSGSFSRSAVNIQAGAVSGLSNVFSSGVVVITLLFFTPLLYHLPQSVLAAIIMMAVVGLLNVRGFLHAWRAQKYDGIISLISFVCTLAFAPHLERGILIGVVLSLGLLMFRSMKPDIAYLSKHPDGTYRDRERFSLRQCRHIAVIRYNGSLFFANVNYLEEQTWEVVASMPELKHILIVGNGINELDASGEEMLSMLVDRLREAGYDISFSGLNDAVLDTMRRTFLHDKIGEDHLYRNATRAIDSIFEKMHEKSEEETCPLKYVTYVALPVSKKVKRDLAVLKAFKALKPESRPEQEDQ